MSDDFLNLKKNGWVLKNIKCIWPKQQMEVM